MTVRTIEISVGGKWRTVPAIDANGKIIIIRGRWVKVAHVNDEEWLETELEDPEACVKGLRGQRSQGLRADIFTFTQKPPSTLPRYQYPAEWDSVAVARTSSFKEWWEKLPQETRKNVRRSQKRGVVITVKELDNDLIRGIVGVNNDSPVRQERPYTHYGKSFEQVKKDQSSFLDRSDFICAHLGDELIGFLKLVYRGETASILQLLPKASHNDKRLANALVAKAVERCEARGVSYLTYGMFNYGKRRNTPLQEFKIRNGFEEILMPRFYVPLTAKGALCIKVNLHRGLIGILPHSLITTLANARAKWYKLSSRRAGVAQW